MRLRVVGVGKRKVAGGGRGIKQSRSQASRWAKQHCGGRREPVLVDVEAFEEGRMEDGERGGRVSGQEELRRPVAVLLY